MTIFFYSWGYFQGILITGMINFILKQYAVIIFIIKSTLNLSVVRKT